MIYLAVSTPFYKMLIGTMSGFNEISWLNNKMILKVKAGFLFV